MMTFRRVHRHQRYGPDVCFYLDGVDRYDCRRGVINMTAHERNARGERTFFRLNGENQQLPVCNQGAIKARDLLPKYLVNELSIKNRDKTNETTRQDKQKLGPPH